MVFEFNFKGFNIIVQNLTKLPNTMIKLKYALLLIAIPLIGSSQMKVKFGKVSKEELEMKVYEKDSSADAVILFDKGNFVANTFKFTRHKRIKILKQSGTSRGNIVLNIPSKSFMRAFVFNLENGEIIKEKLQSASIYEEERVQGDYVYKLFLPNVKVGSVIELEYAHYGIPYEWRFQDLIPTVYSEVKIDNSPYLEYSKIQKGFETVNTIKGNQWVAKDVPAFNIEPHISHYSNYITKFEFQLISFTVPGRYTQLVSSTWEIVGRRLLEADRFGGIIKGSAFLNQKAKELRESDLSLQEKIAAAYDFVKENMNWNKAMGVYGSHFVRDNFTKTHSGSVADINLVLVALLKKMDIDANPVILSTRSNGLLTVFSPSLWRINYVLVQDGENSILLDATEKDLMPGMIPERALNGQGWVVLSTNSGKWVDLYPKKPSEIKQYVQIAIKEDGAHEAIVNQSRTGYHYQNWLKEYKSSDGDEGYSRMLESDMDNLTMLDYEVSKHQKEKSSSTEKLTVDIYDYVDDLGNELILNPYIICHLLENPYKGEERKYPVDIAFPSKQSALINVKLPENFIVGEVPEPMSIKLPGGGASFLFQCKQLGQSLQISYKFQLNKVIYTEEEYPMLRNFYSIAIKKLNESIQITKKT